MLTYLKTNWYWLAPVALWIIVSFCNAFTAHYGTKAGAGKFFAMISEWLSFLTSAGVRVGVGPLSKVKLPGQSVAPVITTSSIIGGDENAITTGTF